MMDSTDDSRQWRQEAFEEALAACPPMSRDEELWEKNRAALTERPQMLNIFRLAEVWARFMEKMMVEGKKVVEIAEDAIFAALGSPELLDISLQLTASQEQYMRLLLRLRWKYGAELRF